MTKEELSVFLKKRGFAKLDTGPFGYFLHKGYHKIYFFDGDPNDNIHIIINVEDETDSFNGEIKNLETFLIIAEAINLPLD